MEPIKVIEEKKYEPSYIESQFNNDDKIISYLQKKGVLVTGNSKLKDKDFSEEDYQEVIDDNIDKNDKYYKFIFVGIICINDFVILSCPKYFSDYNNKKFKEVLKVIERYKKKFNSEINNYINNTSTNPFNEISVSLYLLNDYFLNGLYIKKQNLVKINANGEIDWNRTINKVFPFIKKNRPIYFDLYNKVKNNNNNDIITKIHKAIISDISRNFKNNHLSELLDIKTEILTSESLSNLGNKDYLLNQIKKELNNQFNTDKQNLLKTLYTYIDKKEGHYNDIELKTYGTNRFNLVWEDVCQTVLKNQLNTPFSKLPFIKDYLGKNCLIEVIDKPYWEHVLMYATDTLIPDLITIREEYDFLKMYIIDAKYYHPTIEIGELSRQPGIESVVKQYMYELAYKEFKSKNNITKVSNSFLIPTDEDTIKDKKVVSLKMLDNIGLHPIKVKYIPATDFYKCYLNNTDYDILKLSL